MRRDVIHVVILAVVAAVAAGGTAEILAVCAEPQPRWLRAAIVAAVTGMAYFAAATVLKNRKRG